MQRILLVDDDEFVNRSLRRLIATRLAPAIKDDSVSVETFTSPMAGLERANGVAFSLALSDYRMPGMNGVAFLTHLRRLQPRCMRVILSAHTDLSSLLSAINEAHIFRYMTKPWNDDECIHVMTEALAFARIMEENQRLADEVRAQRGLISRQELELARLEAESPGITRVKWDSAGGVVLEDD